MTRQKHALNVSEAERDRIRELYIQGVRVADIVKQTKRSESVVARNVRGLKRPRPHGPSRNAERDARMVEMRKQGATFRELGIEFGLSATRACDIVSVLTGRRRPPARVRTETSELRRSPRTTARLTRAQVTRRNATIERLWLEGVTYAQLARRFMLAFGSVKAIVRKRLRRRGLSPGNAWRGPRVLPS